jgi:1-phosphofructokinase
LIVTVTPNPSIDRTLRIPPLQRGAVVRATSATAEPGGKGINVSRALASEGVETIAVVPVSEASAGVLAGLLGATTPLDPVTITGEIRVNVSLVEDDGTVTKINEPGPPMRGEDVTALIERTVEWGARARWVVGCGSLPPGAPSDLYATLARRAPEGVRVAVDADGEALKACLGCPIDLLKPNRHELEQLIGRPLRTLGDVVAAARDLIAGSAAAVLVSLGPDGAVLVDDRGATHAEAPIDDVVNPVGAGDALLAGYLAADLDGPRLATAVAWSVAACRSPGTRMRPLRAADRDAVVVHPELESDRVLHA